jgi:hypothetical protein
MLTRIDILDNDVFRIEQNQIPRFYLVFGIDTINRSAADPYDPYDLGTPIYDTSFHLEDPLVQSYLVQVCDDIYNAKALDDEPLVVQQESAVRCWMNDFRQWRLNYNLSFPVLNPDEFWLYFKGFLTRPSLPSMPGYPYDGPGTRYRDRFGWTDGSAETQTLLWCEIEFLSTVSLDTGPVEARKHFDGWEKFSAEQAQIAPEVHSWVMDDRFVEMILHEVLLKTTIGGAIVSIVLAYIVLAAATGFAVLRVFSFACANSSSNLIVALFCVVSVSGVFVALVAVTVVIGWRFSIVESLALTVVVGMSVDYNVHVANAYTKASQTHSDALAILSHVLTEVGISVFSGAITTAISVFMLFFT